MKKFLILALICAAIVAEGAKLTEKSFKTSEHPRVYFTSKDIPKLKKKAEKVEWAGKFVAQAHKMTDAAVERHKSDPSFYPSRLAMHWEEGKRHTHFYTDGNFIPRREGNAKYPTIRPPYARSWGNGIKSCDTELEKPYTDGTLTARNPAESPNGDGKIPFERTGQAYENINDWLLRLAYHAAIIYTLEGDEAYAKFAADIVWTLVRGGAQQLQINPDDKVGNCGFLSWETLGDTRHYWAIPLIWDMLYGYFHEKYFDSEEFKRGIPGELWAPGHTEGKDWALDQFHVFFEKMIDNKLERGGGLIGNWNLNEHQSAMLYALALDDDKMYKDGKGREYYTEKLVYGPTTEHNGAYVDVLRANIEPQTGLWPEAPGGYGQGSIAQLVKFGFIYWKNGIDLLSRDELLFKASGAMPQMTFPNGFIANVGDSSYHRIWSDQLELMLTYNLAKKNKARFIETASILNKLGGRDLREDIAFFFYLPAIPEVPTPPTSRVSYAPCYPTIIERNGTNELDSLAFALSGFSTKMGHRHANGLHLELYGRGEILVPDIGSGGDYWCRETHEYYRHVAGHNTVTPNGRGAEDNIGMLFDKMWGEPAIVAGAVVTNSASRHRQYAQVESHFKGYDGFDCRQQRTTGIVRTSKHAGYYVDIFRSKVLEGEEKYHDYIFHCLGEWESAVASGKGSGVGALDAKSGKGYDYFKTLGGFAGGEPFNSSISYNGDIAMGVHLATIKGDEGYVLEGPKAFRHYNKRVGEKPCPALLLRRKGEAWRRPFVAVYEPFGAGVDAQVESVSAEDVKGAPAVIAVTVTFKGNPDRKDVILSADGPQTNFTYDGIRFKSPYAVLTYSNGKIANIYRGES